MVRISALFGLMACLALTACASGELAPDVMETGAEPAGEDIKGDSFGGPPAGTFIKPPPSSHSELAGCAMGGAGRCDGTVARWCEADVEHSIDCAVSNQVCGWRASESGYYCMAQSSAAPSGLPQEEAPPEGMLPAPPAEDAPAEDAPAEDAPAEDAPAEEPAEATGCGDITFEGLCEGAVAVWCDDGQVRRYDCSSRNVGCGFIDDETGWFCEAPAEEAPAEQQQQPPAELPPAEPAGCGDVPVEGACAGSVLSWCANSVPHSYDCTRDGAVCDALGNGNYGCLIRR